MATTAATLVVKVVSDTKQAVTGLDNAAKSTSTWKDKLGQASKVAGVGLLALGGAAVIAGKAAAEDAQSQAVLANSMKQAAGATDAQIKSTEDFINKTALATGVADDQLRPAMGNLVRATGDVEKSQKAMNTALDISAATGVDVETVSKAMAKGYAGNESALNKLLPAVTKTAEKTGDFDAVMRKAADVTKGSMAASAETAAGQQQRMQVAMDETVESLGASLLPLMSTFAQILAKVALFVQDNTKAVTILVGILGGLAAAIVVVNYALKAYQVITMAVGVVQKAVWLTNPIFLVIAAIVAVGVAIVVLWKKSETFRDIVIGTWNAIKKAFTTVFDFVKKNWKLLLLALTGPFGIAVALIIKNWDKIKKVAQKVIDWIKDAFRKIKDVAKDVWDAISDAAKKTWDKIKDAASRVFGWLKDAVKAVLTVYRDAFMRYVEIARSVFDRVRDIARAAWEAIKSGVRAVRDVVASVWNAIGDKVRAVVDRIKSVFQSGVDRLKSIARGLGGVLSGPFNVMKNAVDAVIDVVQDLIDWISKIDVPDLGGLKDFAGGLNPFSATLPPPVVGPTGVSRYAAPRVRGGVAARAAAVGGGSGGPTIVVNGALDPDAVARQINRILKGHDRRVGLVAS